ncbi:MAG: hypothetical protein A3F54_03785 [Candidatus Kerfeldbacteria bacterium RIFCSPHIGHO2_12_FULL_48_17]|uniref:histidine kinase n=1 Tax=Candidatus Kerfeldbacteria bacterium RIFCSPHIGHO2_12_FULL_48_17 TaxID=1798542 RepID=A0A1G2B4S2_9BACT|nr:MAG: hypothetical protein A3F54_03785 [Candidatus Kerfeldbacteria bacterium RIFCSPHIGHO2_12_FULL_48_17]
MTPRLREKLIHNLNWIVTARWILMLGFISIALVQRFFGNVILEINDDGLTIVIVFFFFINGVYEFLLRQAEDLTDAELNTVSLLQVVIDQMVFTAIIYFTGGYESSLTLLYIFPLFIAAALYTGRSIMLLSLLNVIFYVGLILGEILSLLPPLHDPDLETIFLPSKRGLISNTVSVSAVLMLGGLFATFISAMVRDREREIIQETDRVNAILDRLSDAVIMVDAHNRIAIINQRGEKLTKRGRTFLIGRILSADDFPVQFYTLGVAVAKIMATESMISEEVTIQTGAKGQVFRVSAVPVRDSHGGFRGCIKIISDMTKEREVERIKSNFISVAAHQLRTPLSGVKWMLSMLLKGDLGPLTQEQRRFIERGYHNHERMIKLVSELLDISKIEDGRMEFDFQAQPMEDIVSDVVKQMNDVAEKKKIKIRVHKPVFALSEVKVDREKIGIAVQNILDNAVKYTPKEGEINITLRKKGSHVITTVEDNGIGIPQDQQPKIFMKFYRASNAISENTEGTGLGLFIVEQIIKNHEGEIGVDSQEGKGTKVWMALPLA